MPENKSLPPKNRTGVISIIKILQHFGVKDLQKIYDRNPETDEQLDWKKLQKLAKKYNISSTVIRPTVDELREIEYPVVAKMNDGAYIAIGSSNEEVVLAIDPRESKPKAIPMKEFLEGWSNEMLIFSASFSWTYFKKQYNIDWFLSVVKRYKKPLFEVVFSSFFIQVMAIVFPLITQVIIDKVIGNNGLATLTVIGWSMVLFFAMQSLLTALKTYILNHTTNKLDAILGTRLFRHLIALPLPYYERKRVGEVLMRIDALEKVRSFLTGQGLTTILDVIFSVVFIAFMLWYSVPLTLIALTILPLYVVQLAAMPILKSKMNGLWQARVANQSFMVESITNVETVKSLAVEPQFVNKWENLIARYIRKQFEMSKFMLALTGYRGVVDASVSMAILWYGGNMVMNGEFTLGQLIAFQMISRQATTPLTTLLMMWWHLLMFRIALGQVGDILNTPMEPVIHDIGKRGDNRIDGSIEMSNVSFRYRVDLPLVLKNVNLTVLPGQKIGIVGRSGSGKSTLTNLVQNLYIPEEGQIVVGGIDTREANLSWLREQIGVVMQENYLFNSSVRDNIAISRPTATMDEIIRAARLAGAHDFILELKEGYDTKVGERGDSLSGGQRQRVAIARALLANPPILIFDEATSALDYESERIILNNMGAIGAQRTMLIIAHRLSAVRRCDKIIVIDKGEIVESGTHDQLLALGGLYRYLYDQQESRG
ncbi:MAG: peptidase domain-containing ABC transporter [Quinella sp. 3Q1]|nr:peptidase domain-containing ABC transporter [Quinella sp. 3Q1]MBR6888722.1 peptidase domain-containing ABC transporter [Selenomonadaceae bacterium]